MMLALLYPRVDQEIALTFLEFCREGNWYDKIYDIAPLLPRDQYSLSILIPPDSPVEEGGQSSIVFKIRDLSCFGIVYRSIFRIELLIRPEMVRSPFLGPRGQMGVKRGSKLSISLKMITRSCKFVQICNFI